MRKARLIENCRCYHLIVTADNREVFGGARRSRAESRRPSRIANRTFFLNDEKQQKARRREYVRFEETLPDRVPHLLEKGSDKVAYDLLKQLADGPRRPAELRVALGVASANFFTASYLTPIVKAGYMAVAGGEKNRYLPGKQYKLLCKGKAVACA